MPEVRKPHSESLKYALEIAHNLVNGVYPSIPSYERELAHALVELEEQFEALQIAARNALDASTRFDIYAEVRAKKALRELLDSSPASGSES